MCNYCKTAKYRGKGVKINGFNDSRLKNNWFQFLAETLTYYLQIIPENYYVWISNWYPIA
jgi:hypothetical protein